MASFQLELVSPEKLLLSRKVDMVVFPAAEGEMGVLAGHAPMIVSLRGGVIAVHEGGQVTEQLFVAGGFAEVAADRVTILADEATPLASLSKSEAQSRLAEAEAAFAAAANEAPEKREPMMARMLAARAMVEAAAAA
ncbi:MAG: ATP synthase F1 subunit epsilon [Roseomonas sp.]|jgi:F-type H+-transporting ATPase subunit epsilon|nr:ATP synthase F1 subunit epsilon [Roseomonas sp.]MCA3290070.1 ATP synthase F1 subunit epsilon [Roseomonas sp.]MCA3293059.1 ATP synthase F1 subunit epsilon [Roseomonas sp.]MCA3297981.1 ATP synthase F1 subunit epsilon [Roseomonas sp.]MCA3300889.1 ATP synthase F1 subunit epsilon [Roseomonas sp.]